METDGPSAGPSGGASNRSEGDTAKPAGLLPEVEIYLVLLVMVFLIDHQHFQQVGGSRPVHALHVESSLGSACLRSHCAAASRLCFQWTATLPSGGRPLRLALMLGLCMQCISLATPLATRTSGHIALRPLAVHLWISLALFCIAWPVDTSDNTAAGQRRALCGCGPAASLADGRRMIVCCCDCYLPSYTTHPP